MAEFIGARISLVSNSDIRYVGTLHEINSETSTVALENVSMLGTEGRRPDNEVAALDNIYEYILFRGTDVKDLRIEEAPVVKKNKAPQMPNDPAILGSGSRPTPQIRSPNQQQMPSIHSHGQQVLSPSHSTPILPQTGHSHGQPQYPQIYPHPTGWGRNAPPAPGGYTAVPYAGPPVWYHGPQHSFPPSNQFTPYGYSAEPSSIVVQQQSAINGKPIPIGAVSNKQQNAPNQQQRKHSEPKSLQKAAEMSAVPPQKILSSPSSSKPSRSVVKTDVSISTSVQKSNSISDASKSIPTGPKTVTRIQPALPLRNIPINKEHLQPSSENESPQKPNDPSTTLREATQAASAVESTNVAKLSQADVNGNSVDEKAQTDSTKNNRKPNKSSFSIERTRRGNHKSHGSRTGAYASTSKVEVPSEDFDFQSANAKFNKEDLIKEATSVSPIIKSGSPKAIESEMNTTYNKATSFFDNISSEVKDRQEAGNSRLGGREWRGEEQKKNLETFGQESIDNSHRGGYRGRGRGRGGYRGRGYSRNIHSSRGRTDHQNRGNVQAVS